MILRGKGSIGRRVSLEFMFKIINFDAKLLDSFRFNGVRRVFFFLFNLFSPLQFALNFSFWYKSSRFFYGCIFDYVTKKFHKEPENVQNIQVLSHVFAAKITKFEMKQFVSLRTKDRTWRDKNLKRMNPKRKQSQNCVEKKHKWSSTKLKNVTIMHL